MNNSEQTSESSLSEPDDEYYSSNENHIQNASNGLQKKNSQAAQKHCHRRKIKMGSGKCKKKTGDTNTKCIDIPGESSPSSAKEVETKYVNSAEGNSNNATTSKSVPTSSRGRSADLVSSVTGAVGMVGSGARGAVEALIIDLKEVSWWLTRISLSEQTFTRFHDQWQVFLCGASTSLDDEGLEKRRRRRLLGIIRILGSLLPLAPVGRPYLRVVTLNSLSTSTDSLFAPSGRSLHTPVRYYNRQGSSTTAQRHLNRLQQLQQTDAVSNLSRHSHESGFSTGHYLDSDDSSSCLGLEVGDTCRDDDRTSVYSAKSSQSLTTNINAPHGGRRRTSKRSRPLKRSGNFGGGFLNSTENFTASNALESALPFTDPEAMNKIKSLEVQLEELKKTISQILDKPNPPLPTTPPSSPSSRRKNSIPPLPPPPPPPPPPPLPGKLLSNSSKSTATGRSLQELVAGKQGNLTKAVIDPNASKERPGSWSSVINAIKGGSAKLRKVERRKSPCKSSAQRSSPAEALRAALSATLHQRFKSVHGSPDKDEGSDTEYSDTDGSGNGRGKWDSETWQSPPSKSKSSVSPNFDMVIHKDRLKKMSPVKLAKNLKNSPDALLAAVNTKLQSNPSKNILHQNSLIFNTPATTSTSQVEKEDEVPDSNELFRKFLQKDRRKSFGGKKVVGRSSSVPNISPFLRSVSKDESISTIHEDAHLTDAAADTSEVDHTSQTNNSDNKNNTSATTTNINSASANKQLASHSSSSDNRSTSNLAATASSSTVANNVVAGTEDDASPNSCKLICGKGLTTSTPSLPKPPHHQPRTLSYAVNNSQHSPAPFGQHLLRKRSSSLIVPGQPKNKEQSDVNKSTAQINESDDSNNETKHTSDQLNTSASPNVDKIEKSCGVAANSPSNAVKEQDTGDRLSRSNSSHIAASNCASDATKAEHCNGELEDESLVAEEDALHKNELHESCADSVPLLENSVSSVANDHLQ